MNLKSLTQPELADILRGLGQPAFRAKQVFTWLHKGVRSYDEMTNLPKSLREALARDYPLYIPKVVRKQESQKDGTIKYLWQLSDGNCVETVLSNFEAAAEQGGYDTVDGYLQASYGEDANWESFSRYLYNAHLAAAYSDFLYAAIDPTEQEVAAYFARYAGEYYENYGVTQDDGPMAEAVVLSFETEQEARQVYDEYLENGGGEEVLINLGNIYCGENGYVSAAMPGQFSEETEAWLCGEDRQAGDCAVIPEDGGASVAFYVGSSGQYYWQTLAREDLCRETYQNEYRAICGSYTFLVNYDQIHIIPPEGLYEA